MRRGFGWDREISGVECDSVSLNTKVPAHSFERRLSLVRLKTPSGAAEHAEGQRARREYGMGRDGDPIENWDSPGNWTGDDSLTRALRSHQLWLSLTYLGLLVLMARAYA